MQEQTRPVARYSQETVEMNQTADFARSSEEPSIEIMSYALEDYENVDNSDINMFLQHADPSCESDDRLNGIDDLEDIQLAGIVAKVRHRNKRLREN
jgi:hypothetical protein